MSKRSLVLILAVITVSLAASLALASDSKDPITGTWDCQAKGGPQGDRAFTLYLEKHDEIVQGSVSSSMGDAQITSASFKEGVLEIHIDTDEVRYLLKAKLDSGALSGTWSKDNTTQGTWEGKKQAAAAH